jgi:hypothetical protein
MMFFNIEISIVLAREQTLLRPLGSNANRDQ